MRLSAMLTLSVLLAGCNPTAQPQGQQGDAGEPDKAATLELTGQGLTITGPLGTTLAFGSPRAAAEAETARLVGLAEGRTENDECGAGPMQFTAYPGGLTLNFQDGKLVGWLLEGDAPAVTDRGVGIGDPIREFAQSHSAEALADSTLGNEYYSQDSGIGAIGGEGDKSERVAILFAGLNCFFR